MKKARHRRYLNRRRRRQHALALRRKGKAHYGAFLRGCQPDQEPSTKKRWQLRAVRRLASAYIQIVAPTVFGLALEENRTPLLRFVTNLRRLTLVAGRRVAIDFSRTTKMYSDGTLLFAAELDQVLRAVRSRGERPPVRCNYPKDDVVEQVLQHLEILQRLGLPPRKTISAENVKSWKMYTDRGVLGEKTTPLVTEFERVLQGQDSTKLYAGLVEAMANCQHHAYRGVRRDNSGGEPTEPRWWMFAEVRDGKLSVTFCDLGIGINRSLLKSTEWSPEVVCTEIR